MESRRLRRGLSRPPSRANGLETSYGSWSFVFGVDRFRVTLSERNCGFHDVADFSVSVQSYRVLGLDGFTYTTSHGHGMAARSWFNVVL